MLAGLVFKKDYFFLGQNNEDQLVKIVNFLGSEDFYCYLEKYEVDIKKGLFPLLKRKKRKSLKKEINSENRHLCSEEIIDLINILLQYDPDKRMTAEEALNHPFFNTGQEFPRFV